ncbi:pseudouridine synthase [Celeribacter litoreus]|uniref:pseudouridine synthase n=1 Tax=Celeribacter litoreus TaxID=2876714 RepID=UPI001CCCA929|nr:pseudouridine synthase [Celeribacter litoreus]MCA0042930.1 rRNA pseudouridine synthase [Celeribacter litoreus]
MTDSADTPNKKTPPGDRIAKVMARSGVASRRDAEQMIEEGRVMVNGRKVTSPALNVMPKDKIFVDGKEIKEAEPPRLWLYHKPTGLVTSAKDEKGRETVFDKLPPELPRVMSVGRLDLNSEGLLLLTNDGEIKRRLELPDTGWLRKYRVRVKGTASEATLDTLRKGVEIDGEKFQPMEVVFDRQQGANAWLTVGLREGKNREIRRAMEHIGLTVNRLIRISYGPFRLGTLQPGGVEEVRGRVLRDQLGLEADDDKGFGKPKRDVSRGGKPGGPRKETLGRDSRDKKPFARDGGKPQSSGFKRRDDDGSEGFKPRGPKPGGKPRSQGFKRRDDDSSEGFKPRGPRPEGGKPRGEGFKGKPRGDKPFGDKSRGPRKDGDAPRGGKPYGDKQRGPRKDGDKPGFKSHGFKSHGGGKDGKPRSAGFKSHGGKPTGGKTGGKPRSRDS